MANDRKILLAGLVVMLITGCGGNRNRSRLTGSDPRLSSYMYNERYNQSLENSVSQQKTSSTAPQFGGGPYGNHARGGQSNLCQSDPQLCIRSTKMGGTEGAAPAAYPMAESASAARSGSKIVSRKDVPLAVAMGLCSESDYNSQDPEEGDDMDSISGLCEINGPSKGFSALRPEWSNVYKVAAVTVPREKRNIFLKLADKIFTPNREWVLKDLSLDRVRGWLEGKEEGFERLEVHTERNGVIRMPASNEVGTVVGGNQREWLTLGGVSDPNDTEEAFSVGNLPGMASNQQNLDVNDAFVYVVEAMISYPKNLNPVLKIMETDIPGQKIKEASGIVVFLNGNPVIHTFKKKQRMGEDHSTSIAQHCPPTERYCHLVAMLYASRFSNSWGAVLRESVLIDMDSKDDRGAEPLPSEIALPVATGNYKYANGSSGQVIRILADPGTDQDLISTCDNDLKGKDQRYSLKTVTVRGTEKVDLTDCAALFHRDTAGYWAEIANQIKDQKSATSDQPATAESLTAQLENMKKVEDARKSLNQAHFTKTPAPEMYPEEYEALIEQLEHEYEQKCRTWLDIGWFGLDLGRDMSKDWCKSRRKEIAEYRKAMERSESWYNRQFNLKNGSGIERDDNKTRAPEGAYDEFEHKYDYDYQEYPPTDARKDERKSNTDARSLDSQKSGDGN